MVFKKKKKEVAEFKEEEYLGDLDDDEDLEKEEDEDLDEELEEEELKVPKPTKSIKPKEEKKVIVRTMVVAELPAQQLRRVRLKDGSLANLVTIEEALSEILEIARGE